jgi:hypothetical protein
MTKVLGVPKIVVGIMRFTRIWRKLKAIVVAAGLRKPQHRTLRGQTHNVSTKVLAPVLQEFFMDGGYRA